MDVDIATLNPPRETGLFALDDLAVPVIFKPGKLPRVSIGSLRLNLQSDGIASNSWLFKDMLLERNTSTESRLKTSLPLPAVSELAGQLEIRMLQDSLEAQLQLHLPDQGKGMQIDFRQSGDAGNISSEILGQGHLQALPPLLKAVFPGMDSPLGQLKGIQGDVILKGHFTGSDEQILDYASITARNVMIDTENENLGLELDLAVQREQDSIQIEFMNPGTFHFRAGNDFFSSRLSELLQVTQASAKPPGRNHETLDLTIAAHNKIKLQINDRLAGEFSGAASLDLSSSLLDLSLELAPDVHFRMAELLSPPGSGKLL